MGPGPGQGSPQPGFSTCLLTLIRLTSDPLLAQPHPSPQLPLDSLLSVVPPNHFSLLLPQGEGEARVAGREGKIEC